MALTYCGNVHAAEDLDAWLESTARHAVPVADAARGAGRPFGLGVWWNDPTVATLATDPGALDRVRAFLAQHDLAPWTLNVFPFGSFHADVVKEQVYRPGWDDEERLLYTRRAAEVAAQLGGGVDGVLPLSTLPLGFRGEGDPEVDYRVMARNIARAASALAAVEDATGICPVLAIEPEPCCILGTAAEAARFLEEWVFEPGAWSTVPEDVLRRHVGVCVDLCHLFVVGEDPVAVCADFARRGIGVPKIQVSSCLEVRAPEGLAELWSYEEARWLHQTFGASGRVALDLRDARAREAEFATEEWVRCHYHVPVGWDRQGSFGSTRSELERCLRDLPRPLPLLEVETYTWSVVEARLGAGGLVADLIAELEFVAARV